MFRSQQSITDVAQRTGRAVSTVYGYLCDFIRDEQPISVDPWVQPDVYRLISATADRLRATSLSPVFEALDRKISYNDIRVVLTHRAMQAD
jgi:ATP-dependent DNA helicase RecQ